MLQANERLKKEDTTTLLFEQHDDGLVYYADPEYGLRLCISDYDGLM